MLCEPAQWDTPRLSACPVNFAPDRRSPCTRGCPSLRVSTFAEHVASGRQGLVRWRMQRVVGTNLRFAIVEGSWDAGRSVAAPPLPHSVPLCCGWSPVVSSPQRSQPAGPAANTGAVTPPGLSCCLSWGGNGASTSPCLSMGLRVRVCSVAPRLSPPDRLRASAACSWGQWELLQRSLAGASAVGLWSAPTLS